MPESVETTIFKLQLDGSAYIEGADKLSASTSKLSAAQEKANAKLAELQKTHNAYKKSLEEIDSVIKANEKETIELTKQLNSLKDSEKGATAEATRLKAALRDISVNTKEFRAEAKELGNNISATTKQINIQTKEIEAGVKANGNFVGSLGKAFSGLRTLANLIPGIGIGGLVALIAGPLVDAFGDWFNSITQASGALKLLKQNQENINEVMAAADKSAGKQITDLKILYETATNVNVSMDDRLKAVRALQQEFPDYFKNISDETILNGKATDQYNALALSILATAKATAAKAKLDELEGKQLDKDFEKEKIRQERREEINKINKKDVSVVTATDEFGNAVGVLTPAEQERAVNARFQARIEKVDQDKKDLQAQEDFLTQFAGLSNLAKVVEDKGKGKGKAKVEKQRKEIVNIYEQELQKLKADIAKLDEKGFTNEATITKAIEEDFKKRADFFKAAAKKGQLTAGQLTDLSDYLKKLQDITLSQNLKSFREAKAAYLAQIQAELDSLQIQENAKRISAIQDRFERERQTIIAESERTANDLTQRRDKQIAEISKNAAKNGLTAADVAPQIEAIKGIYSKLLDDIEIIKNQKLQQLSFDTFEKLSEDAKRLLDSGNLGVSQGSLINIKEQTALFLAGKISYKQYQKELTDIARFEASERFRIDKLFLESEIKIRKDKLASDKSLTSEQTTRLEDEIRRLQQQLADAEKGNVIGKGVKPQDNERLKKLLNYANAIGAVADSVIQFWGAANEAESKALDRSISLQEKRVDAAQRIAERGNAQYLKAEEDRLKELQVKRENAARKQLGIDAALQASQILVGITGAIAKIATPGIGIAETIGAIAIIVGALATGYGLVKSLQGNQPTFFTGTKDTGRGGGVDGKGGFVAINHPHEAIIPADRNKAYHPAVAAIYDQTIPAEHLNNFVKTYHKIKSVPMPDYSRIRDAAELKIGQDGRMSVLLSEHSNLLKENNELQKAILKKKGVHAELNVDKNGVAMMVTEYLEQMEINKRL